MDADGDLSPHDMDVTSATTDMNNTGQRDSLIDVDSANREDIAGDHVVSGLVINDMLPNSLLSNAPTSEGDIIPAVLPNNGGDAQTDTSNCDIIGGSNRIYSGDDHERLPTKPYDPETSYCSGNPGPTHNNTHGVPSEDHDNLNNESLPDHDLTDHDLIDHDLIDHDLIDHDTADTDDTVYLLPKENGIAGAWNVDGAALKKKVWKNILTLGVIFSMTFTSYNGLGDLQSSLFKDHGLGVLCQSVVYGSYAAGALFIPKLVIRKCGHKWTICGSLVGYVLWMAANGYASWSTMVPSSVLVGLCAGPLWTAQNVMIAIIARQYATATGQSVVGMTSYMFGVVQGMFKIARSFGSLITWSVLEYDWRNSSVKPSEHDLEHCGANNCPWYNSTNVYFNKPYPSVLWTLVGIYISLGVGAIIIAVCVLDHLPITWYLTSESHDPKIKSSDISGSRTESHEPGMEAHDSVSESHEPESGTYNRRGTARQTLQYLTATIRLHANPKQLLILPIFIYSGVYLSFIVADFTESYVTCSLGIWMVSLIILPNIFSNGCSALLSGRLGKTIQWLPQMSVVFVADIGILIGYLFWRPNPNNMAIYFVMTISQGITDGVWGTQASTMVGMLFPHEEAAFANIKLWGSAGAATAFFTASLVCVKYKIYMLLGLLVLGYGGCAGAYVLHNRQTAAQTANTEDKLNPDGDTIVVDQSNPNENSIQ